MQLIPLWTHLNLIMGIRPNSFNHLSWCHDTWSASWNSFLSGQLLKLPHLFKLENPYTLLWFIFLTKIICKLRDIRLTTCLYPSFHFYFQHHQVYSILHTMFRLLANVFVGWRENYAYSGIQTLRHNNILSYVLITSIQKWGIQHCSSVIFLTLHLFYWLLSGTTVTVKFFLRDKDR